MKGLVIRTTGSWYRVLDEEQTIVECRLRGNYRLRGNKQTNPIAVGDTVEYEMQADGTGLVKEVMERENYIVRKATKLSKQSHVLAANIDLLCVVVSLSMPRTSTGFIDRLLVTAEAYHIEACIVINKIDTLDFAEGREAIAEIRRIYEGAGYKVYECSALRGDGVEQLRAVVRDKKVLFSGHSGVGKSALLSAISPGLNLRVGAVSEWSEKGKHTTTFAEIFPITLPDNNRCYLIDTPGIKEFGIIDIKGEELSHFFPEMRQHLHGCHFANCTHRHEPGCAVKQAVEEGKIEEERYINYVNIYESL